MWLRVWVWGQLHLGLSPDLTLPSCVASGKLLSLSKPQSNIPPTPNVDVPTFLAFRIKWDPALTALSTMPHIDWPPNIRGLSQALTGRNSDLGFTYVIKRIELIQGCSVGVCIHYQLGWVYLGHRGLARILSLLHRVLLLSLLFFPPLFWGYPMLPHFPRLCLCACLLFVSFLPSVEWPFHPPSGPDLCLLKILTVIMAWCLHAAHVTVTEVYTSLHPLPPKAGTYHADVMCVSVFALYTVSRCRRVKLEGTLRSKDMVTN